MLSILDVVLFLSTHFVFKNIAIHIMDHVALSVLTARELSFASFGPVFKGASDGGADGNDTVAGFLSFFDGF